MINYFIIFLIILISVYVACVTNSNLKKIISVNILQNAIWLFFISMSYINDDSSLRANPIPAVLMLTAVVVGLATNAVAISLIIRINECKKEE